MTQEMEEAKRKVDRMLKLFELRLLRCSLANYRTLPCGAEDYCGEAAGDYWLKSIKTLVDHIEKGEYIEALHSEPARLVFDGTVVSECENTKQGAEQFYHRLEDRITDFLSGGGHGTPSGDNSWLDFVDIASDPEARCRAMLAMALGIAALSVFVQCNLTGPRADFPRFPFCYGPKQEIQILNECIEWDIWSSQQLMIDGCDLLGKYTLPQYFILAKMLLIKTRRKISEYSKIYNDSERSISWWVSRLLLVQQKILDERSRSLYEQLQMATGETLKHFGQLTNVIEYWGNTLTETEASDIVAASNLETGIEEHAYGHIDRARQLFKYAETACALKLSVTGALGFRTVHQREAKAQMVLVAASLDNKDQMGNSLVDDRSKIPQVCARSELFPDSYGDSDILLAPKLIEEVKDGGIATTVDNVDGGNPKMLVTIKQAVILAQCLDIMKSTPDDEMQDWQMAPYIEAVDAQKLSHFMVRCFCQILRIHWERKRNRTKQRAIVMMDELVQEVCGGSTGVADRMHYAYCVCFPTISALLKEYAELMVSCGIIGDALRIFEDLALWDNLIYCYCLLGKKAAATDLIKERLQHNPEDPRLWCSLGDVTLNDDNYIKALEVSGNHFARAERSLARSAYNRGAYKKSQSHWEAALALNSLHPDGWFALGSAALKARDFDKAIDGFTHAVQLDPDNGEAWNNIACLHMMKKRNKEAFIAFKEALKFRRNSWQMWENYSQVAMDTGNFGQALEAIKMVLDLTNNKRGDLNLLSKLVEEMESRKISSGCTIVRNDGTGHNLESNNSLSENDLSKMNTRLCSDKPNNIVDTGSVHTDSYDGVKYSFETEQLVDLCGRILQQLVQSGEGGGEVWGLYARWHKFKGNSNMCTEALLKQVRAYQGSDLSHNEELFKKFARASMQLCEQYIDIASSTGSKRELSAAQMHLKNAIKQAENFSGSEEYKALGAWLQRVQQELQHASAEKDK